MKIYVEKLPKSCKYCPMNAYGIEKNYCSLYSINNIGQYIDCWNSKRHKKCPLVNIKTHDPELVKEVCEKIRNAVNKSLEEIGGNCNGELYGQYICKGLVDYDSIEFDEILDQIQKEYEK